MELTHYFFIFCDKRKQNCCNLLTKNPSTCFSIISEEQDRKYLNVKAADLQMLKKDNGKYWSSYVMWRNLLLLTP